jgi:proline iminopeptidase
VEASINGTTLYYEEAGEGIPCIALHGGLGFDHTYLKSAFAPLEDAIRFIHVDQRGNGRSGRPPLETITMQQLAADVDALREHLGLEKVAVLGHSFGGFVALEYATTFPDRLSHLFCLSTSPGAFEPTGEELAERGDRSWVTPEVDAALAAMFSGFPSTAEELRSGFPMIAPSYVRVASPDLVTEAVRPMVLNPEALRRGFEILPGWSVVDSLGVIGCPTLVLCGRYDLHTTPECAKRLSTAIPRAELVWLEESAHFTWLDEPDAFLAAIRSFVERHPS